ncbi:YdeI/OmpD-associated family protein [Dyadobacter psychrotolerans]|uniref:YdeI/OmpD-associated family protein n=1 Tax=Dyadobacter psychrotolerans TaxID=2541721 RepID=UPI001C70D1CD|nr:YdeI/OmpD-associated family protein [Dyadobacter psychrotolerans]
MHPSKINKTLIQQLIDAEQMTPAGFEAIEVAKQNNSWSILDEVEELILPVDLTQALASTPNSDTFFDQLSGSDKRNLLQWLVLAKQMKHVKNGSEKLLNLQIKN